MLLALLAENESGKWKQAPLSFQSPHTYLESSTHIDRYMIIAALYFSGKNFSQTRFSKMPQIQIYSANAIMIANVFKYLPKSEEAVHTFSLKKLF